MQRKFFHLYEGVGVGEGGSNSFWGPILWKYSKYFWLFQGEKMVLTKVAHNDAKSLKKIGCIFPHHLGGGGVRPWCGKFHKIFIFLTLYPSLNKIFYFLLLGSLWPVRGIWVSTLEWWDCCWTLCLSLPIFPSQNGKLIRRNWSY